ncbi:hypothetical protein HERIO_697 [Hepatospora eriocheir]|uniref:HTH psq-type domain-containing protein n=1 Tax=Hepatospora eriocheir TaxID=1081669 RepID=A0A1X0QCB7_9MICR|nr:hypothetical protein HERIO_697 [Hepatospora eriocheir]
MAKHITKEDKIKIVTLKEAGVNNLEIINKFKISKLTFFRIIQRYKLIKILIERKDLIVQRSFMNQKLILLKVM